MKRNKTLLTIISVLLLLVLWNELVFATATIARLRRSPYLPWQWVPQGQFDEAHNVWGNNASGSYLPDNRFSVYSGTALTADGVIFDSITGLYWESTSKVNSCIVYNTTNEIQNRNTNCWAASTSYPCTYCAAEAYCENLNLWWFDDWRIPSPLEFQTLNILYNSSSPTTYYDNKKFKDMTDLASCNGNRDSWNNWTNAIDLTSINDTWKQTKQFTYNISTLSFSSVILNYISNAHCTWNSYERTQISVRCVRWPIRY
jgi:hypothetical protein